MESGGVLGPLFCTRAEYVSTALCPLFLLAELTYMCERLSPFLGLCSPLMFELLAKKGHLMGEGLLIFPEDLSSLSVFLLGRWSWGGDCNSGYYYLVSTGTGCERPSLFLLCLVW